MEPRYTIDNHDEDIETAVLYPQTAAQEMKPKDTVTMGHKIPIWKVILTGTFVFVAGIATSSFSSEKPRNFYRRILSLKHHGHHHHPHNHHYDTDGLIKIEKQVVSGDEMTRKLRSIDKNRNLLQVMKFTDEKNGNKESMKPGDEKEMYESKMKKELYGKKKELSKKNEASKKENKLAIKKELNNDKKNPINKKEWSENGKKSSYMEKNKKK